MQTKSFPALGISAYVERALAKRGVTDPFPIQSLVIPTALEGSDVLAKSPTGSGKTLAFGLVIVAAALTPPPSALPAEEHAHAE